MKKVLWFAIALIIVAGMIGCSKKENALSETSEVVSETTAEETSTSFTNAEEKTTTAENIPGEDIALSTHTESYMHGECSVALMYPRYGDGEHDLFDVAMRNHAVQKFNRQGMMPEDSAVYEITACDIKYESEYFVSAVMTGQIINPTAAHDSHFAYTVNADPRNGRVYLSEELIGDIEIVKTAIAEGMFEQSYGIDGLMDAIDDGTVTYENDITVSWRQDYGVFPDMYFTEDKFGVMAEIPHVVGGYAGFEIPYVKSGDMMNPVAQGLVGIIVTTD